MFLQCETEPLRVLFDYIDKVNIMMWYPVYVIVKISNVRGKYQKLFICSAIQVNIAMPILQHSVIVSEKLYQNLYLRGYPCIILQRELLFLLVLDTTKICLQKFIRIQCYIIIQFHLYIEGPGIIIYKLSGDYQFIYQFRDLEKQNFYILWLQAVYKLAHKLIVRVEKNI